MRMNFTGERPCIGKGTFHWEYNGCSYNETASLGVVQNVAKSCSGRFNLTEHLCNGFYTDKSLLLSPACVCECFSGYHPLV